MKDESLRAKIRASKVITWTRLDARDGHCLTPIRKLWSEACRRVGVHGASVGVVSFSHCRHLCMSTQHLASLTHRILFPPSNSHYALLSWVFAHSFMLILILYNIAPPSAKHSRAHITAPTSQCPHGAPLAHTLPNPRLTHHKTTQLYERANHVSSRRCLHQPHHLQPLPAGREFKARARVESNITG